VIQYCSVHDLHPTWPEDAPKTPLVANDRFPGLLRIIYGDRKLCRMKCSSIVRNAAAPDDRPSPPDSCQHNDDLLTIHPPHVWYPPDCEKLLPPIHLSAQLNISRPLGFQTLPGEMRKSAGRRDAVIVAHPRGRHSSMSAATYNAPEFSKKDCITALRSFWGDTHRLEECPDDHERNIRACNSFPGF
jgi:hypothetical protein